MKKALKQWLLRRHYTSKYKVQFGKGVFLSKKCHFEGNNAIGQNSHFRFSRIGFGSYVSTNCVLRRVKIGRFCAIGDGVRTQLGLHPVDGFASIHPAFYSTKKQAGFTYVDKTLFEEHKYTDDSRTFVAEIGHDVWIGNNVMIMDGLTIGDGAVIAAGSVVTKNVEPYAIVGGIPAKEIKKRFDESTREFLLNFKWWNKEPGWIEQNREAFTDIKALKKLGAGSHG